MSGEARAVREALAVYEPEASETGRVPPGYKQTEVGVIPEDWEVRRVGEICDFIVPGRNKPREFNGNIPWITTTDLEGRLWVSESKVGLRVSRDEAESVGSQIVPSGSVIMTCVGDLGIVAVVSRDLVMNQQLHAFIPSEVVDATYLSNALKNQKPYMESLSTKTALPYLNKDNCNSIPIALPPLREQRAIAAALSGVDDLIFGLDKLISKKRALKTAAAQHLLTGKQRLPGFSGEWETRRLGEVCRIVNGGTPSTSVRAFWDGGIPWCTPTDITKGNANYISTTSRTISEDGLKYSSAALLPHGTLLLCTRATIGELKIAAEPICTNQGFKSLVCGSEVNNEFLFYKLTTLKDKLRGLGVGSTFLEVSRKDVADVEILYPSLEEQTAIAAVLSDMDAEIEALEARREKTRQVKQGMMQELLTGKTRLVEAS